MFPDISKFSTSLHFVFIVSEDNSDNFISEIIFQEFLTLFLMFLVPEISFSKDLRLVTFSELKSLSNRLSVISI